MSSAFLIGPEFLGQIRRAVAKSEGEVVRYNVTRTTVLGDGEEPTPEPPAFRICEFTGAWAINQQRSVKFYNITTTPNTIQVTNVLIPVPELSLTTVNPTICCIGRDGTAWHLINVLHASDNMVTGASLTPSALQFARREVAVVSRTIATAGISIASCDDKATPAQLSTFLG